MNKVTPILGKKDEFLKCSTAKPVEKNTILENRNELKSNEGEFTFF